MREIVHRRTYGDADKMKFAVNLLEKSNRKMCLYIGIDTYDFAIVNDDGLFALVHIRLIVFGMVFYLFILFATFILKRSKL
jgi:hypothetical protein